MEKFLTCQLTLQKILMRTQHKISKSKSPIEAKSPQMSHLNSFYNSLRKIRYVYVGMGRRKYTQEIKNFKNKATLVTKISALKIANNSFTFTGILTKIINRSFSKGVFTQQLKTARVVPIFKKGSETDVGNYKHILLLSSFSKIYEKLMYNRIMDFLNFNGILHGLLHEWHTS